MAEAQVERDLIEYFVDRRGALEPPSNFGSMAAALEVQRGSSGCETDCSARSSCSCSDATWRVHQISQTGQRGLAARIGATEMDERRLKLLDDEYPVRRALAAVGERIAEVLEVGCSCSVLGLEGCACTTDPGGTSGMDRIEHQQGLWRVDRSLQLARSQEQGWCDRSRPSARCADHPRGAGALARGSRCLL
jgi:hypothetical protein